MLEIAEGFDLNAKQDIDAIKQDIEQKYSAVGSCTLTHGEDAVSKMTYEIINPSAKPIVETWESLPDFIGEVTIQKPLPIREKKTVIGRIVNGTPTLKDIYTLKRFSEVLSPDYSFLITEKPFDDEIRKYLEDHPHIMHFLSKASAALSAGVPIVLMTWDGNHLEMDHGVVRKDPFDPKHMWH